jgi:hypothetical protein
MKKCLLVEGLGTCMEITEEDTQKFKELLIELLYIYEDVDFIRFLLFENF